MIVFGIVYLISFFICAITLFLLEYPTEFQYAYLQKGDESIFKLILFAASFIPIINTMVAIWLIVNSEIEL